MERISCDWNLSAFCSFVRLLDWVCMVCLNWYVRPATSTQSCVSSHCERCWICFRDSSLKLWSMSHQRSLVSLSFSCFPFFFQLNKRMVSFSRNLNGPVSVILFFYLSSVLHHISNITVYRHKFCFAEELFVLLMELATDSSAGIEVEGYSLTSLACSGLISLTIALGDTGKLLTAIKAMLMSVPRLAAQVTQVGVLFTLTFSLLVCHVGTDCQEVSSRTGLCDRNFCCCFLA